MRQRFIALVLCSALGAALTAAHTLPALAAESGSFLEPPKKLPSVSRTDRTQNLDFLFGALKVAPDEAQDTDLAIKLLDAIVKIKPDYIEAWNRRAMLYYMKKDYGRSLADIREVLKREPRHFGALAGLGLIMQDIGDDKQALEVYRRALAIHPKLQRIPELVKTLQEKVEGRDI